MDEDRRLRWLGSWVRFRHLRRQQADAAVAESARACDAAAQQVTARHAEVQALSRWRVQATTRPQLDLGMLQQSMNMAATADAALVAAQAELERCRAAYEQAVREQLLAYRREDHASERRSAVRLAVMSFEDRNQSEQSVEAWSQRKRA